MLNKCQIIGNCGADPEIRFAASGDKIANLRVAVTEKWNDKASGERKERTEWFRVACFNDRICDVIEKYVRKGSKLYIEGQLQTRQWTDQQGQERYTTEVVISRFKGELQMLDSKRSDDAPAAAPRQSSTPQRGGKVPMGDVDSDAIPF